MKTFFKIIVTLVLISVFFNKVDELKKIITEEQSSQIQTAIRLDEQASTLQSIQQQSASRPAPASVSDGSDKCLGTVVKSGWPSQAIQEWEDALDKAEKELAKFNLSDLPYKGTSKPSPITQDQAKAIIADYEAATILEFKTYIIDQYLKIPDQYNMWEQVKYRIKRAAQLKAAWGLPGDLFTVSNDMKVWNYGEKGNLDETPFKQAELENEAISAMNGGCLPANWPTNPPRDGQMSIAEVHALQKDAQRRIDAIRAAHGGQLPPDWKKFLPVTKADSGHPSQPPPGDAVVF
jgi:hypothetical protein